MQSPEREYTSSSADGDPHSDALSAEVDAAYRQMIEAPATAAAGFALMLLARLWDEATHGRRARLDDPSTWTSLPVWSDERDRQLLQSAWSSPAGVDLLRLAAGERLA